MTFKLSLLLCQFFFLVPISHTKKKKREKKSCVGAWGAESGQGRVHKNRWWRPGSYLAPRHLIMNEARVSCLAFCSQVYCVFSCFWSFPHPRSLGHRKLQRKAYHPMMPPQWSGSCILHLGWVTGPLKRHKTQAPSFLRKPGSPNRNGPMNVWRCTWTLPAQKSSVQGACCGVGGGGAVTPAWWKFHLLLTESTENASPRNTRDNQETLDMKHPTSPWTLHSKNTLSTATATSFQTASAQPVWDPPRRAGVDRQVKTQPTFGKVWFQSTTDSKAKGWAQPCGCLPL